MPLQVDQLDFRDFKDQFRAFLVRSRKDIKDLFDRLATPFHNEVMHQRPDGKEESFDFDLSSEEHELGKAEYAKSAVLLGSAFWFNITCEVRGICEKPKHADEP